MRYDQPLTPAQMREALGAIMDGSTSAENIAQFLRTLAARGETAEEIATAVEVLREHAVPLPLSKSYALCDTCGTGGDGQGTMNVSTVAALVAAAAGVRMSKHGNRAASSRCGSADLMEALGVSLAASPACVARCIEELGFGFCFAPAFHPAMKVVAPVRKTLGIRTIFNLVGPLANPAPLTFQLVGVSEPRLMRPMAEALLRLGIRHGMVVHGRDGLDEVTTTEVTAAIEIRDGRATEQPIQPETMGIPRVGLAALRGGDPSQNAQIAREVLAGRPSAFRDIIVLNAACAMYVADGAPTIQEGLRKAAAAIDQGEAARLLQHLTELTTHA
ncbi:MAG: anthranilate phosphoribosyltransferase [Candidatus Omnitrophica bacterium]|nr:anthranilate phosphoribosyltransferase [Candidatus Omnitrophota bacterium]